MKMLFKIIIIGCFFVFSSCKDKNYNFKNFNIVKIYCSSGSFKVVNNETSSQIIENLNKSIIIKGPVKGIKIRLNLINQTDTVDVFIYRNSSFFYFNKIYYKGKNKIIPDLIFDKTCNN